ncbi:MAG TPA: nitroreductase family protein [Armatimonadota bacterium]|nr:nitroreductase family protein [Armatimonadota bacterium]
MEFNEVIDRRYSVREYHDDPVPEEVITRILEVARNAPSACNIQPWHFFVVRDGETRRKLFPADAQAWIAAAPVIIVACSYPNQAWVRKYDGKNHADVDMGIVMEHLVLAATNEGLGTCWVCSFDPARARDVLQLPADMEPVAITPLGFAKSAPRPRSRKPLEELVTWR